ncbi:MAG: CRTAC1 family protein [Actinomycetota bacterium]
MEPSKMWGSAWGDYDADGDLDLFVGRHTRPPGLFENRGGTFSLVQDEEDLSRIFDRHGCAWGEANGDGRPDLFCAAGARRGTGAIPNRLYIQMDEGFVDRAREFGVRIPKARGRTVNWIDLDSDSDLDLFIGNKRKEGHPNVTFLNLRDGFERTRLGLNESPSTVGSSWADWDADGDSDVMVFQYGRGHPVAYENRGGGFVRTRVPIVNRHRWRSGAWGDYNGDGWPDLHLIREKRSVILKNRRGTFKPVHTTSLRQGRMSAWLDVDNDGDLDSFVVQGASPGGENLADVLIKRGRKRFVEVRGSSFRGPVTGEGDSVSSGDFDLDGRIDLYVTHGFSKSRGSGVLLKNDSAAGNWAILNLEGSNANPLGFGATFRVDTSGGTYRRQITDGFNYRSQSATGQVHLGLDDAQRADVRISWADGTRDCVSASHSQVQSVAKGLHRCRARD